MPDRGKSIEQLFNELMESRQRITELVNEHKRVEKELREETRLSRIILDNMPCVALLLKPGTREIVISNEEAIKVGAVPGKQCFSTWGQRDDPCPWCLAPAVWTTGKAQHLEVEALGIVWDAHWIPISRDLYMHYAFDITKRKRAEEVLQETSETLRALIQASPLAIVALDVDRNVKIWNRAAERIFGWGQQEVIGRPIPIVSEDKQEEFRSLYNRVSRGKEITGLELRRQKKDGSFIDVSLSTAPFYNAKGDVIGNMGVLEDITEHKKAEEKIRTYQNQLRSLASELSLAEERERRRISIDLHDHIGQALAISKIKLGELRELASSTNLAKSLGEINELIGEAVKYTRSLTFDLSPPILYELGFEAAVEWLTEQIQEQHGILIDFVDDMKPKPMSEEIRVLLFKVVRELLFNVVKHAKARNVKVSILKDEGEIRITVHDDGVGFNTFEVNSNLGRTGGFGFFNIRERVGHLGGRFEIESKPGLGTRVSLMVPLA